MKVWQIQVPLLNSRDLQARAIYLRMIYNNIIHGFFLFFLFFLLPLGGWCGLQLQLVCVCQP